MRTENWGDGRGGGCLQACTLAALILCGSLGAARAGTPPGPDALTEASAAQWGASAEWATASVSDDGSRVTVGSQSIRFDTTGGFDTWLWAPAGRSADWNLLAAGGPRFWVYAENPHIGFQNNSPWIILASSPSDYVRYQASGEMLNSARGQWLQIAIPLNGNETWTRTVVGTPDLAHVAYIEIHADTWDHGFTLWVDGLGFTASLAPPEGLAAVALNGNVQLSWQPAAVVSGQFSHYAIYRSTSDFDSVVGMTPIGTVGGLSNTHYLDATAVNGTHYYYAVTAVFTDGSETTQVEAVGPRTPRDETDLQVVSVSRTPRYPRYDPLYTGYTLSEASGFGPYHFTAATGLGSGQTPSTQRWPKVGDQVTYTATVRNRGTNTWAGALHGTWRVDGGMVSQPAAVVSVEPGEVVLFTLAQTWDGQSHEIGFAIDETDARADNNQLAIQTKSVAFLSYVDVSYLEQFREDSPGYPGSATDDFLDWLNRHMARFNRMFAEAGSAKRVHYGLLEVLPDGAADPGVDRISFAIFPFRYYAGQGDMRSGSGYYRASEDIDFGLLHEMAHQLGLIDIYQLDVSGGGNYVSGLGYSGPACLMHGVSDFLSAHSALAMNHWLDAAHGYYGQYLYRLPAEIRLRILGFDGQPLPGATVKVYQYCDRPGQGKVITNQIKAQGLTNSNGEYVLPNVPINPAIVPPVPTGDTLHDNPFGYVAVVGTNGVLHFRVEYGGGVDYAWLDITEANVAYELGQTDVAVFERQLGLGGATQHRPPDDMTELNATDWSAWAQGSSGAGTFVEDDASRRIVGQGSLKSVTDGGFDTYVRYPRTMVALWDLSAATKLKVSFYAVNVHTFQNGSPWIRLKDADNNYFEYQYYQGGYPSDLLNEARYRWRSYEIPLDASSTTQNGWRRTTVGSPSLTKMQFLEIHADTWDYGFTLWLDGVGFDLPAPIPGDLDGDRDVDADDFEVFVGCATGPEIGPPAAGCEPADLDHDSDVDQTDFAGFQRCVSGAGVTPDANCAG